ncbi:DDB1- and CUL4-associated factor 15 isoform X2 [Clupea harengus]|uniref:DDB1- and CUL4-associated factor 15 isoform X2 n=1 Tax=Clupea harengus TaxID=7950 RepID=A0A6P8F4T2_CLUHA|nr:DDB1- and CUL4-associated factor 15 isoform X2 [Clupea harengus]
MAPSSKSGKHDNKQKQRTQDTHVVKLLNRGKLTGQLSQRWFLKRRPRIRVPLKTIVSEATLRAGHIFLGFTKCGRYVLSYTRDYGDADDTYTYHLYWWEFNLHKSLKQVHRIRLFAEETIYSDLYLAVCEWHNAQSKIVIFGFNMCSSSSALLNMVMSDENNRDIYITIISMPSTRPCIQCKPSSSAGASHTGDVSLEQGFVLNARYQVVHPFPTFQPALQLKKEQVILLNTSYFLVACAISLCQGEEKGETEQILYRNRPNASVVESRVTAPPSSLISPEGSPECVQGPTPLSPSQSQAAIRAREFAADIFRRAQASSTDRPRPQRTESEEKEKSREDAKEERTAGPTQRRRNDGEREQQTEEAEDERQGDALDQREEAVDPPSPQTPLPPSEPGYVNYTRLKYWLQQQGTVHQDGGEAEDQDDKVQLPFTVSDLNGNTLELVTGPCTGQCVCVEQLTLDFEYVISEVVRNDAEWSSRFCSFSDYDVVILEMCPETNIVVINIGLMLLAFPPSEDKLSRSRPESFHTSLRVSWDLNTGVCCTVGVGDLKEMKGQTSGSVWSGYRKSCVDTVMRWLVPESSLRYINRMTNEALHKGMPLQVLADSDGGTWITR